MMKSVGTVMKLVSGGYVCAPQSCISGVLRALKAGIKKRYMDRASRKYTYSSNDQRLLNSDCRNVYL